MIIQHTGFCVNCAELYIPPLLLHPHSWASLSTSQILLLLFGAPVCSTSVRFPAHTCLGLNHPETGPGKHPVCLSAALQSVEISLGLATGIKLSSPNREINGGELHPNTQRLQVGYYSLVVIISASWHCQLQLNVAPLIIPTCGVWNGKRSAVSC